MSAGGTRAIVILGLILATSVITWGLNTIESRLAPIPSPVNGPEAMNAGIDALAASMMRWQLIYIPILGLGVAVAVALLLKGRLAWLEAVTASVYLLTLFVMIRSTTVSWASSLLWAGVIAVSIGAIAQILRRSKMNKAR